MTISPLPNLPVTPPLATTRTARPVDRATPAPDNSLRGVLSSEEREFFEQAQKLGPVSYGRSGANRVAADVPLGQHLDLRA